MCLPHSANMNSNFIMKQYCPKVKIKSMQFLQVFILKNATKHKDGLHGFIR